MQRLSTVEAQAITADLELKSAVYAFTPHGLTFNVPVAIEIPYTDDGNPVEVLKKPAPDQGSWEVVSATFDGQLAQFETVSFSVFALNTVQALDCNDAFYQGAWDSMTAALSSARTCTPNSSACGAECSYEARAVANGNCITLGFANTQAAADQMVAAYNSFTQAVSEYPCGHVVWQCDSMPEFSAPSYCGTNGKCAKCIYCDDNPPPPDPCSGAPCYSCDESTDSICVDMISDRVQIARQNVSGNVEFYLRYNDDQLQTCPILALIYTDSDSLEDYPRFEFRQIMPGDETYLGPLHTPPTTQVWYYKIVWAVYMIDAACSGSPVLGCTDSDSSFCPATTSTSSWVLPEPGKEVFLYEIPWWNGSEWRNEAYLINRAKDCSATVTIRTTNKSAVPPWSDEYDHFPCAGCVESIGSTALGSPMMEYFRYQILQANYN